MDIQYDGVNAKLLRKNNKWKLKRRILMVIIHVTERNVTYYMYIPFVNFIRIYMHNTVKSYLTFKYD
jgi:hypothetical protein